MEYKDLCDFEVLYRAHLTARRRKRKKRATAEYDANALENTENLSAVLVEKTYLPSEFDTFKVYEPKERVVQAPAYVDKVVLHAIVDNGLYDVITRGFIRDNHASQKGKGEHDALLRLKCSMQAYYRRYETNNGWVLKADVRHFFASIPHDKLKATLKELCVKRNIDADIYNLLCVYIDNNDEGLPLGYQTSQLLALLYLDEFDHWVKERRGAEDYGRYMDDFWVISPDKKALQILLHDMREYMAELGLELNQKTAIFPLKNGLDFLGFHSYLKDNGQVVQKLREDSIKREKAKIKRWRHEYAEGKITKEMIISRWIAWDAHAAHGDTRPLREKIAKQVSEIVGVKLKPRRKIRSTKKIAAARRSKQLRHSKKKNLNRQNAEQAVIETAQASILPWDEIEKL